MRKTTMGSEELIREEREAWEKELRLYPDDHDHRPVIETLSIANLSVQMRRLVRLVGGMGLAYLIQNFLILLVILRRRKP